MEKDQPLPADTEHIERARRFAMMGGDGAPNTPDLIVTVISKLLTELVARNDQLPLVPTQVTPFHSSKPPTISVKSYLEDRSASPQRAACLHSPA